jgi:ribosomal protein L12E/L44/L45/RPP1/RPP2
MNASTLPKSVFTCAGPYAEAAEAAAEAMRPEEEEEEEEEEEQEEEAPAVVSSPDATTSRASEADTCTYSTELDCLKAGGRTAYACAWCKSAAIPSSCATLEHASKLPPSDFDCGNSTRPDCDLQKTIGACEGVVGCLWCTSKTVKPICGNYMNASTLPKSVFTCAGPYAEAAEAAAEAMRPEEEEEEAPAVVSLPGATNVSPSKRTLNRAPADAP